MNDASHADPAGFMFNLELINTKKATRLFKYTKTYLMKSKTSLFYFVSFFVLSFKTFLNL